MNATPVIRIPITNIYEDGDYTGLIYIGKDKKPANVLLDTGSSSLAVDAKCYNPAMDPDAQTTDLIQEVSYVDNSHWIGSVVLTDIGMGQGTDSVSISKVSVAVSYDESKDIFGTGNGILGLAYSQINDAYIMPGKTFPFKHSFNDVQNSKRTFIDPYFTELEKAGVVANKFSFYTLRSQVNHVIADVSKDPLNNGFLIIGGGEESTDLYLPGGFQNVRVLDDQYYDTNLKAVVVDKMSPIEVPPPSRISHNKTNSVIDSGTASMMLDQKLYNALLQNISNGDVNKLHALKKGYIALSELNLAAWPDITFVMESDTKGVASLTMTPDTYWQSNADEIGYATFAMEGDNGGLNGQSILGLPLMNNYFCIFDRSADKGLGVIRCARIKK